MNPDEAKAQIAALAPQLPAAWASLESQALAAVGGLGRALAYKPGRVRDISVAGAEERIGELIAKMAARIAEPAPVDPTTIPVEVNMRRTIRLRGLSWAEHRQRELGIDHDEKEHARIRAAGGRV